MVLSGSIGKNLVEDLEANGIKAVGINGKDGHTLQVEKRNGLDLGFVGEVRKVDTTLLDTLMDNDFVPVVSPVGVDGKSQTYNINADYAASAVAGALHARKLVFLTDVEGILTDKDNPETIIRQLSKEQAEAFIASGIITGGMIPKVQCCLDAIGKGVESVHVLNGKTPHSMLLEIFTHEGVGTMVYEAKEEQ
jgi:acetylglutamate kinase